MDSEDKAIAITLCTIAFVILSIIVSIIIAETIVCKKAIETKDSLIIEQVCD